MTTPTIEPISPNSPWIQSLAFSQFENWGVLTGYDSVEAYCAFVEQAAKSASLPRILAASEGESFLGSVNLLPSEMTIRQHLSPWLGQLFVVPACRSRGVAAALLEAAASYVAQLGHDRLFLFTSGSLPGYYRRLGWQDMEDVVYLGKVRTIMKLEIDAAAPSSPFRLIRPS